MTWVHDQIYAAGGDHIPSTWKKFADQTGVTAVLHLAPGSPARFHGSTPLAFLWLDVSDEAQVGLDERQLVGKFIFECVTKGQRVLIHSSLGRHRTRWAYVAYCIYAGRSVRVSLRVAAERPWLSPYHTDIAEWEAFAEALHASRSDLSRIARRRGIS